jgi:ribosomal protein L11 methyltransferase
MHVLRLRCRVSERDFLIAGLHELGTAGILETEMPDFVVELDAWFEQPFEPTAFAHFDPIWQAVHQRNWVAESQAQWQPIEVGRRLWLAPDWIAEEPPSGRLRLTVHPGDAPGSGYSDPTQLALEALERSLRRTDVVLDAGAGSGILTAAAALLGAVHLIACEIDPAAARTAATNFRRDKIKAGLYAGSPRSLKTAAISLIIANLNAATLLPLASELTRVLTADGRLIVTGFRDRRATEIRRAFERRGLPVRDELARNDWRCLVLSAVT